MRQRKKIVLVIIAVLLLCVACNEAKKPEQKPITIVVPQISHVPFNQVKYIDSPEEVKKIAMTMKKENYVTWARVKKNGYVIVARNKMPQEKIKVESIEQRQTAENVAMLNIKLQSLVNGQEMLESEPLIVKFTLNNIPTAVGFQIEKLQQSTTQKDLTSLKNVPTEKEKKVEKVENDKTNEEKQIKGTAIRISQPLAGELIKSPVEIKGNVGSFKGDIRVCVKNAEGKILAEKSWSLADSVFDTSLSFSLTDKQEKGFIEAVLINPEDKSEVSRVTVTVLLGE